MKLSNAMTVGFCVCLIFGIAKASANNSEIAKCQAIKPNGDFKRMKQKKIVFETYQRNKQSNLQSCQQKVVQNRAFKTAQLQTRRLPVIKICEEFASLLPRSHLLGLVWLGNQMLVG